MDESPTVPTPPAAPKRRRGPGRPFPKGVSGNPGGRPMVDPIFKTRLKDLVPASVDVIEHILKNGKDNDRLRAAEMVLERIFGKAPQSIEHTGGVDGVMRIEVVYVTKPTES